MKRELLFLLVLLLFTGFTGIKAQIINNNNGFILGAYMGGWDIMPGQNASESYDSSGMNTVWWQARSFNHDFLQRYNVIAQNGHSTDWINHYATAFYSKWQSEENQPSIWTIGVNHSCGDTATWKGIKCWSSIGVETASNNLVFGPHYYQKRKYVRSYDSTVNYTARFHMAFDKFTGSDTDKVCRIKVVLRYQFVRNDSTLYTDMPFLEKTLTVGDFPADGSFNYFGFGNQTYSYPDVFPADLKNDNLQNTESGRDTTDVVGGTGIQFCVDWLGDSSLGNLYVDFAEVYDNNGWNEYINPSTHNTVVNRIHNYLISNQDWDNILYWLADDEPRTIDAFVPYHTVDSLVHLDSTLSSYAPLITNFYQVGLIRNGDSLFKYFNRIAKPMKLLFDDYPFYWGPNQSRN